MTFELKLSWKSDRWHRLLRSAPFRFWCPQSPGLRRPTIHYACNSRIQMLWYHPILVVNFWPVRGFSGCGAPPKLSLTNLDEGRTQVCQNLHQLLGSLRRIGLDVWWSCFITLQWEEPTRHGLWIIRTYKNHWLRVVHLVVLVVNQIINITYNFPTIRSDMDLYINIFPFWLTIIQ